MHHSIETISVPFGDHCVSLIAMATASAPPEPVMPEPETPAIVEAAPTSRILGMVQLPPPAAPVEPSTPPVGQMLNLLEALVTKKKEADALFAEARLQRGLAEAGTRNCAHIALKEAKDFCDQIKASRSVFKMLDVLIREGDKPSFFHGLSRTWESFRVEAMQEERAAAAFLRLMFARPERTFEFQGRDEQKKGEGKTAKQREKEAARRHVVNGKAS